MSNSVWDWSPTAASNNAASPYGWTSGSMKPTEVEPTARQMMATISEAVHSYAAGGTSDAITLTLTNPPSAYTDGMEIKFRASAANTTTTPTLNINSLGAKTITRDGGSALQVGDIVGNLAECTVRYNLANTRWELVNPTKPQATAVLTSVGSVTLDGTYIGKLVTDNASGVTTTLPAANSVAAGSPISFIQQQSGTFTIQRNGTDTIMGVADANGSWGGASLTLTSLGEAATLISDGSSHWYVVSRALASSFLGAPEQSLQDVHASRAYNTTYTNSTGRPIVVYVEGVSANTSGSLVGVVGGFTTVTNVFYAAGVATGISFVVPPGSTYQVTATNVNPAATWIEYR